MELKWELECPNCKRRLVIAAKEAYPGNKKKCPNCGLEIKFEGDDMRKAQKALDDFMRNLRKFLK